MQDLIQTNYAIDTFYFLVMGVLVMFMACGFSMLEAGMVRAKNTAEILTKNVSLYAVACIMYMLVGYQLMYLDVDPGDVLPSLGLMLQPENTAAQVLESGGDLYYANRADYFFQVVFVGTAMSIVSGAVAERMRLWPFLAFAVVMTAFIYPVQGMWTWGGGWLAEAGYSDFAGSGVVHLCGGAAALAGVLIVGPRAGKYDPDGGINAIPGCNMPLATLGMFVLWFGWFGFNGGSELKLSNIDEANAVARVFVNTNLAACGGLVAALVLARVWFGKADLTMALNGALAGLVSITAEPLAPSAPWAMVVGMVAGVIVVVSIVALDVLEIDDPVGAISVHGVCGIWGVLAVVFSKEDATLTGQITGIVGIVGWVFLMSLLVWGALNAISRIRISAEDEEDGMDLSETGLEAYPDFAQV